MKALTLWQPWASLKACGAKRYETRSWKTKYRGKIAIHAAAKDPCKIPLLGKWKFEQAVRRVLKMNWCFLPTGAILATGNLVGVYPIVDQTEVEGQIVKAVIVKDGEKVEITGDELLFGDWTPGRFAWEIIDEKQMAEPISAIGRQGLWNWEE